LELKSETRKAETRSDHGLHR